MNAVGNTTAVSYHCGICQLGNETVPMPESMHAICMECFKKMAPRDLIAPPATIIPPTVIPPAPPPVDAKKEFLEFLKPFLQTEESFAFVKKEYEEHPEKFFIYKDNKGHYGCIYLRPDFDGVRNCFHIEGIFLHPSLPLLVFFKEFLNSVLRCNKILSSPDPELYYQHHEKKYRQNLNKIAKSLGYWTMDLDYSNQLWILTEQRMTNPKRWILDWPFD